MGVGIKQLRNLWEYVLLKQRMTNVAPSINFIFLFCFYFVIYSTDVSLSVVSPPPKMYHIPKTFYYVSLIDYSDDTPGARVLNSIHLQTSDFVLRVV